MATEASTFEQDLGELEKLVADMEAGKMSLEDMVKAFEKGQKLVAKCNRRLNDVEKRIAVIKNGATEPLDAQMEQE